MYQETNIFEILNDKYFLPKKVRLFESFSGIGCQRMAFKRLGIEVEMVGISEIDKYAIQSYMAIHSPTRNWGDITKIRGQDLPEVDVFTYSFPCTDLSKAGKQKGLSSTRSGLVYEVLRILHEMNKLPQVLIMENVVDLVQTKFIREFNDIQRELESLGYKNYTETLNAKDYGVAQNRDRVFMVSILGEYYYEFPKPFKLTSRLKDYLETNVDEKYYLSDKTLGKISKWNSQQNPVENAKTKDDDYVQCITAKSNTSTNASMLLLLEPMICASRGRNPQNPKSRESGLETVQMIEVNESGLSNTLTTVQKDNMVVEPTLRIRKLTPRETGRLMGMLDDEIDKQLEVVSNSQAYKQHGNGIVVDVFAYLLSTMIKTEEQSGNKIE